MGLPPKLVMRTQGGKVTILKPETLSLGTQWLPIRSDFSDNDIPQIISFLGRGMFIADVIRRIRIHPIKVARSLEQGRFLGREFGQPVAELFAHRRGVVACEINWISIMTNPKLQSSLCSYPVSIPQSKTNDIGDWVPSVSAGE